MQRLTIFKAGDTLPELAASRGNFQDWILKGLGIPADQAQIVTIHEDEPLPDIHKVTGVIISGSHTPVPDRISWVERASNWLQDAVKEELPILGICFGHQLLSYALGGKVEDAPLGPEFGTIRVHLSQAGREDPLFSGLWEQFLIPAAHYQAVTRLPQEAQVLAASSRDPYAAFRVGKFIYGVQFHPEFDSQVTAAYIQKHRQLIKTAGDDPDRLLVDLPPNTAGKIILRNFLKLWQSDLQQNP